MMDIKVGSAFEADTDKDGNPVKVGFYVTKRSMPRNWSMGHMWFTCSDIAKFEEIPESFGKQIETIVEPIK